MFMNVKNSINKSVGFFFKKELLPLPQVTWLNNYFFGGVMCDVNKVIW